MVATTIVMLLVLLLAGAVIGYAAYPARDRRPRRFGEIAEKLEHLARRVPTLDEDDADRRVAARRDRAA
jgi:hypothetical protein